MRLTKGRDYQLRSMKRGEAIHRERERELVKLRCEIMLQSALSKVVGLEGGLDTRLGF